MKGRIPLRQLVIAYTVYKKSLLRMSELGGRKRVCMHCNSVTFASMPSSDALRSPIKANFIITASFTVQYIDSLAAVFCSWTEKLLLCFLHFQHAGPRLVSCTMQTSGSIHFLYSLVMNMVLEGYQSTGTWSERLRQNFGPYL